MSNRFLIQSNPNIENSNKIRENIS